MGERAPLSMFGPLRSGLRAFELRRRAVGLAAALLAALLWHGLLFDSVPGPAAVKRAPPAAATAPSLQVRAIVADTADAADAVEVPSTPQASLALAATLPTEAVRPSREPLRSRASISSEPPLASTSDLGGLPTRESSGRERAVSAGPEAVEEVRPGKGAAPQSGLPGMSAIPEAQVTSAESTDAALAAPALAAGLPKDLPKPAFAIAPGFALRYAARRPTGMGTAELVWRPEGELYEANLIVEVAGEPVLVQASRGRLDVTGLMPTRFTDRRRRSAVRAVNFGHEVGRISFSGPSIVHELPAGAQDRVSWILQLAGVLAGARAAQDQIDEVVIPVAGVGGDLRMWVFRFAGEVELDLDATSVHTLKYQREPGEAHEHRVEVWLDPLRHFLPVRLQMRAGPNDPGLDLLLQAGPSPPP